ncbi:TPA: hypothetical protein ACOR5H_002239 [Escherichia coli]|uniref:hypothetical protein n=1 Tax=Escherichia coli TaxID=562 RepID=UPI0006A59048|nr:hypothetical protein [Escherichia coli]MCN9008011.1 hypothetical protein [Escherichia coli]TII22218.1 hypothetical protein EYY35_20730 [Escherichia coli]TIK95457.1 hypothetical protein EYX78_18295 [Escherichia coli]HCJ8913803.1 hypothetical protein [Escherichia coli]HCJ8916917.1 hypothetical protein [Escherichia coli]
MNEQIKQDIDLIEILFYLKKKIRVILFIIAICMAMVLLFLYINKDNIKVSYSLKINQTTPGILVSCDSDSDSDNNFACQTTMTEDVIQRITTFFQTSPDVKNRVIKMEWSGDKRDLPAAEAEMSRVQVSIIKWYASEYHNGRQVLDEIQTTSAINSELYTKMIYLTRNWSLYPNGDGCVTISSPEIKSKYPAAICLILGFFLSIVISVMFCLVKKMVDEYQQNSGQ